MTIKTAQNKAGFLLPMLIYLILIIMAAQIQAEEIRIRKALDANVFLLEDGRKIKLAYVETPSLYSADSLRASIARRIVKYVRSNMLRAPLQMEIVEPVPEGAEVLPVRLYRKYPLETLYFNLVFLERGYGKYIPDPDMDEHDTYVKAAQEAEKSGKGIWNSRASVLGKPYSSSYISAMAVYANLTENANKQSNLYGLHLKLKQRDQRNNGIELIFDMILRKEKGIGVCEEPPALPYTVDSMIRFGSLSAFFDWNYFGFRLGLAVLSGDGGYCSETDLLFPLLVFGIKIGLLKRLYVNIERSNDLMTFPMNIGLNWTPEQLPLELWLGYITDKFLTRDDEIYESIGMKLSYGLNKRLRVNTHFLYIPEGGRYGLRLGLTLPLEL